MTQISKQIEELGVVPVLVIENAEDAIPLGEALLKGGLPMAEITMRTKAAPEAIEQMSKVEGLCVGAGTVLSPAMAGIAIDAGADFIVSPGLESSVVKMCQDREIPIFPGCITPSEVQQAWNLGLRTIKFFPAGLSGGPASIKNMSSVFREMKFMPTGGVTINNMEDYLSLPSVVACGGTWIAPEKMVTNKSFTEISERAFQAVQEAKRIKGEI